MDYMTISDEIEVFESDLDDAYSSARGILYRLQKETQLGKTGEDERVEKHICQIQKLDEIRQFYRDIRQLIDGEKI